jgi:putative hydrolase|tara:strand:+ start:8699 stop:9943 length:1245 start_codon:yes stop_codon:yes gene_type:complete
VGWGEAAQAPAYHADVASDDPFDKDDPFGGLPFLGDLGKLFKGQGPIAWDVARQFAQQIATEGVSEPNVDPVQRVKLVELARVAELHVANVTSLEPGVSGQPATVVPATRAQWAWAALEAYRPLMERLAERLAAGTLPGELAAAEAQILDGLMRALNPMMMAMSAGSMAGHLATRAFGNYVLPIPRPDHQILILVGNVEEFSAEWSLPIEDVQLWVCIYEIAMHSVLSVPHVRGTFERLLNKYIDGFQTDSRAFEDRFADLDFGSGDPEELQQTLQNALGDPETMLGALRSDAQAAVVPELESLLALTVGYVDYVIEKVGTGLLGSYQSLSEVFRRRRVTASGSDRFVEKLFGVEITSELVDRGEAFIAGVIDRAGDEALMRLWNDEMALPTPNEITAPGLWLARIDLPELDQD